MENHEDSVEIWPMRSDRLTRKTRFRPQIQRSRDDIAETVSDIELFDEDYESGACLWALSDLLADAAPSNMAGEDDADDLSHPGAFSDEYDALLWCMRVIHHSPSALAMARDADLEGWSVTLDQIEQGGFLIDVENCTITLDHFGLAPAALGRSAYFRHVMLTTFIRALREVWHENRNTDDPYALVLEDILMRERVRAADGDTVAILCGWELRAAGFSDVWRYLLGAEEGDMAIVFSRFLDRDPGALFNGAALAYAFRQWYADAARVDGVDHETLEYLDSQMMAEGEDQPPFGQDRIDAAALERISLLPDGKCYLAGLGGSVLKDPFFAGLGDPINQAHLFHMVYDAEVIMVNNVPFRDAALARRIFPQGEAVVGIDR